jgi:hypothetical protein
MRPPRPISVTRLLSLSSCLVALRPRLAAASGLCGADLGTVPVLPEAAHDGADPVQIIDRTFALPAGTVDLAMGRGGVV